MNLEERILNIAEAPAWYDSRELRAIALDVRKMEDRIKQLEEDLGDAYAEMRKQWPVITAVFDRSVWLKAKEAKP